MKNKFLLLVSLASIGTALVGCLNTINGSKVAGVPWINDRIEARYQRSMDEVFNASKDVLLRNGTIASAGTLFNQTNDVRVLEGKVKQCNVWIRIETLEPRLTSLIVQLRTSTGVADLPLAHEIDKEIALELSR